MAYHIEDVIRVAIDSGYLYAHPFFYEIVETRRRLPKNPRTEQPISPSWKDPFHEMPR